MELRLPVKPLDRQQAGQMKPEQDDDHAGHTLHHEKILTQEAAQSRGGGPHRHEDDREPEHEKQRVDENRAARVRPAIIGAHFLQRNPRNKRQVAGYQGEHAGRKERDDAGQKRRQQ